jgi:predicted transcriptional regulator
LRPPCEVVIKYVLPAFRCSVARSLVTEYGLTQVKAASALGTTQAAISYYLGERRGSRIRGFEENELVRAAAVDVAKGLATGQLESGDATAKFCLLCSKLRSTDAFCAFHRSVEAVDPDCHDCLQTGS